MTTTKMIEVKKCPRCGYSHGTLEFKQFQRPVEKTVQALGGLSVVFWWYSNCLSNHEPILVFGDDPI